VVDRVDELRLTRRRPTLNDDEETVWVAAHELRAEHLKDEVDAPGSLRYERVEVLLHGRWRVVQKFRTIRHTCDPCAEVVRV
jgi:hypothetical protein